ncbi:toxin-antitoxin system YwqK family antitoxin [Flavobacteriaceae bacterium LMO-SS05]
MASTAIAAQTINQFDANGERHGLWKKNFDKTNQPRYEGEFTHGKEIGIFKFYKLIDKKSVLSATKEFNEKDNIALVKFFSSTGKLISEGKMDTKAFVGKWTYYHHKTKAVMSTENYNDKGQLDGEKLVYYENGQLAEASNYVNGKMEGASIWYSEKGVVLKEFLYENDELHGLSKYFDNTGQLIAEGAYKRGQKHGIWKYYTNGKLTEEKNFDLINGNSKKQ